MSNPFSKEIQKLKKEIVNEFEDEILKLTISDDGAGGAVAGGSQDDRLDEYIDLLTELFLEKVYAGDLLLKGGFVCDKITTNQLIINRGTGLESDFGDVEIKGIPKSSIDLTGTFLSGITIANSSVINSAIDGSTITNTILGTGVVLGSEYSFLTKAFLKAIYMWDTGLGGNNYLQTNVKLGGLMRPSLTYTVVKATNQLSIGGDINIHDEETYSTFENVNLDGATFTNHIDIKTNSDNGNYLYFPDISGHYRLPPLDNVDDSFYNTDISGVETIVLESRLQTIKNKTIKKSKLEDIPTIVCDRYDISGILSLTSNKIDVGFIDTSMNFGIAQTIPKKRLDVDGNFVMGYQSQNFDVSYNDISGTYFTNDYNLDISYNQTINLYNGTENTFNMLDNSGHRLFIYDENDISLNVVNNGTNNGEITFHIHPQDQNNTLKWKIYDISDNLSSEGLFNILDNNNYIEGVTGIRNSNPQLTLDISGSDGIRIPKGNVSNRPIIADKEGIIRFNTQYGKYEGYANGTWGSLGGLEDIDQDTFITPSNAANEDLDQLRFVTQNKLRFFIDNSANNGFIGINNEEPEVVLDISHNGAIRIPRGTISERPDISDNHGLLRYNVEINRFEGYSDGKWRSLGRIEDVDRDTYIITTTDETEDNDKLRFFTGNQPRMVIDNESGNGFVGVNTESPQYNLEVNGTFNATKISGELDTTVGPADNGYTSDTTNTDISMNIATTTKTSNAISNLDFWLFDYFVNHPPKVTELDDLETTINLKISWDNPNQIHLAFVNDDVPKITNVKVDISGNNNPNWTNVMTVTDKNINTIELYLSGEGSWGGVSTISGTTYKCQGLIQKEIPYDFRIYCINDSDREINYNYVYGLETVGIGIPSIPINLQGTGQAITSISISWNDPGDNDTSNPLSNTIPPLQDFKIDYDISGLVQNSSGLTRYGGTINDPHTITKNNTGGNTEGTTLSNLHPAHYYKVRVSVRNTQNSNYSPYTDYIISNTLFTNSIYGYLTSNFYLVNNNNNIQKYSGYNLDSSQLFSDILRFNNIQGEFGLNTSSHIRTNEISCTLEPTISTFYAYGGTTSNYLQNEISKIVGGFGTTNNGNVSNSFIKLEISNDSDQHSSTSSNGGFWKSCKIKLIAANIATNYIAGYTQYAFKLKQIVENGSTYNGNTLNFYVENFENKPVISNVGITEVITGSTNIDYISGVPMYTNGTEFKCQMNITNLCGHYLRTDKKHATISLSNNGSSVGSSVNITKDSIDGTTHFYYDAPTNGYETSSDKHNTAGTTLDINATEIQFNTFKITLNQLGNNMYENIIISAQPWAFSNGYLGNSSSDNGGMTSITDGSNLGELRSDEKSKRVKDNWNTSNHGTWYFSTTTVLNDITSVNTYDHTTDLSTATYDSELHLLNGIIGWPRLTDYNTFYWPTGVTPVDYSGIGNNGVNGEVDSSNKYRYTLFKFTNALSSAKGLVININGSSGFNSFNLLNVSGILDEEIEIFFKVEGGIAGGSTRDTAWLDANKNGVAINENNYNVDGTGSIVGSMESHTTGNTKKVCVLWSPTSGNVWVKLGVKKNSNKTFTNLSVTEISSS
tara:strand:+ start:125 stop:4882 length:4758 start_codon:yes stop_codon:yes gene_type:complete